jgi:hypothetical protein
MRWEGHLGSLLVVDSEICGDVFFFEDWKTISDRTSKQSLDLKFEDLKWNLPFDILPILARIHFCAKTSDIPDIQPTNSTILINIYALFNFRKYLKTVQSASFFLEPSRMSTSGIATIDPKTQGKEVDKLYGSIMASLMTGKSS